MSKTATVKALNTSQPQLQIVASVQALRQTAETLQESVTTLQEDLGRLPAAIAKETADALEPLAQLHPQISEAIRRYDDVAAIQRQALEAMGEAMGEKATASVEACVGRMDNTLSDVSDTLKSLDPIATAATDLPGALTEETAKLTAASSALKAAANKVRPPAWRRGLALILAGGIGAALVQTGAYAFDKQARLDAEERLAVWTAIWERAEDAERELLQEIAGRPAP